MNDLSKHFVLYAKYWYGRSGNIIEDLRRLLSVYAGLDLDMVTENDVYEVLCQTWAECVVHPRVRTEGVLEMIGKRAYGINRKPEDIIIGGLSVSDPKDYGLEPNDTKELLDIRFGEKALDPSR
jgi:hypothetical protein